MLHTMFFYAIAKYLVGHCYADVETKDNDAVKCFARAKYNAYIHSTN